MPTHRDSVATGAIDRQMPYHERVARGECVPRRTTAPACGAHTNELWRSLGAVTYERFDRRSVPQASVPVALPGAARPRSIDRVDPQWLLRTKALDAVHRPYFHCAHYYFNGTCDMGADCHFIHMVFVEAPGSAVLSAAGTPSTLSGCVAQPMTPVVASMEASRMTEEVTTLPAPPATPPSAGRWWFRDPYTASRVYVA